MHSDIIRELKRLYNQMEGCAILLDKAGYVDHGDELSGASEMLSTWIDGIKKEAGIK